MSEPAPLHRERLLDLNSQTVAPNPNLMELTDLSTTPPLDPGAPAAPAPSTEAETAEANRRALEVANKE